MSCTGSDQEMILAKTAKLVPLRDLIYQILLSSPSTQLQFFLEPLVFLGILKLIDVYGQTVLDLVFYCIRTYVPGSGYFCPGHDYISTDQYQHSCVPCDRGRLVFGCFP